MDTRFLETFLLVADSGSIAAAARRLNVTSAAVAQRMRTLEEEIGFPLIMRNGRTVSTTEEGAAILHRVRDFVLQIRDLKTPPSKTALSGELRLGAISTAITGYLSEQLVRLSHAHPQIEITVEPGTSANLYQRVVTGELDAAFLAEPPFELPKTCDWQQLYSEELVLLKPATLDGEHVDTLLATHPFIRYDSRSWGGLLVTAYLRKAGIRPKERYELDALDAIAVLVDRGLGVALVPDWPPPWPSGLSIDRVPVNDRTFDRRIGVLWSRATPRLSLVRALLAQAVRSSPKSTKVGGDRRSSVAA